MYIICNLLKKNIAGVQSDPAVPATGVRVWLGFEIPHPYPYPAKNPDRTHANLYTKHISPYRNDLEIFTEILSRPFCAVNKQNFNSTGIGKMPIDIPNGIDTSKLQLTEVLYSPEVGYNLV